MTSSDHPLDDAELGSKKETLEQINEFRQKCEDRGGWAGGWSVKLFVATLFSTSATTVSAGIAPERWKALTVVLGGLSAILVGVKDYFRFSNRHGFYRRATVECGRLRRSCLEATTHNDLKSVQDRFDVLMQEEAESAVRLDAAQTPRGKIGALIKRRRAKYALE